MILTNAWILVGFAIIILGATLWYFPIVSLRDLFQLVPDGLRPAFLSRSSFDGLGPKAALVIKAIGFVIALVGIWVILVLGFNNKLYLFFH